MDLSSRDFRSSADIIYPKQELPASPQQASITPELLRDFQAILRRGLILYTMSGGSVSLGDGAATGRSR